MNNLLSNLYTSKWNSLQNEYNRINTDTELETKPTNPLLLFIDSETEFSSADIRIVIFGQETNGWYEMDNTLEGISGEYHKFFNGGASYSYGGQFWNGFKKFIYTLQKKYPDKTIRPVWNNIVKIGCSDRKGFPPDYIYEMEREYFHVIKEELAILKPNVVLFLTGPNYDSIIADNFGKLSYQAMSPFSERQLSKVKLEGVDFAFRTYHPNFLWRNDIDIYFEKIINEISL